MHFLNEAAGVFKSPLDGLKIPLTYRSRNMRVFLTFQSPGFAFRQV